MKELKNLLKLFTDFRQPYLYGLLTAISGVAGALFNIPFAMVLVKIFFVATALVFFVHLVLDQIERIKLKGNVKPQIIFGGFVIVCFILYYLFN